MPPDSQARAASEKIVRPTAKPLTEGAASVASKLRINSSAGA